MRKLDETYASMTDEELDGYILTQGEQVRHDMFHMESTFLQAAKNIDSVVGTKFDIDLASAALLMTMIEELKIPIIRINKSALPQLAENTLMFLLPRERREEIMGCLEEDYVTNIVPKLGEKLARQWYWWQAFRTIWRYNGLTAWVLNLAEELKKSNGS